MRTHDTLPRTPHPAPRVLPLSAFLSSEVQMSATVASHPVTDSLLPVYKRAPMEFVRGEGVDLIDADGKRYLDFTSGIAVSLS